MANPASFTTTVVLPNLIEIWGSWPLLARTCRASLEFILKKSDFYNNLDVKGLSDEYIFFKNLFPWFWGPQKSSAIILEQNWSFISTTLTLKAPTADIAVILLRQAPQHIKLTLNGNPLLYLQSFGMFFNLRPHASHGRGSAFVRAKFHRGRF